MASGLGESSDGIDMQLPGQLLHGLTWPAVPVCSNRCPQNSRPRARGQSQAA